MVTSETEMARGLSPDQAPGSISPSQIKSFKLCPRRWGYEKIAGLESPSGPAAEFGTRVHTVAESYFRNGTHPAEHVDTDAARVFESGVIHYPAFGEVEFEVEQHINVHFDGIDFHGFQDLGWFEDRSEQGTFARDVYVVCDHKTTSDFRWSLSSDDLCRDPQAMIYALAAMERLRVDEVELRWVYMRTRGAAKSQVSRVIVDRAFVERSMREVVVPVASLIKRARDEGATAEDMPQNPSSCRHYGGCPFIDRCNLSPMDRLKAEFNMASLREQLAAQKAAQAQLAAEAGKVKAIEVQDSNAAAINPPERSRPGSLVSQLSTGQKAPDAPAAKPPAAGSMAEKLAALKAARSAPSGGPEKAPDALAAASAPSTPQNATATPSEVMAAAVSREFRTGPAVPMTAAQMRDGDVNPADAPEGYVLLIGCVPIGEKYTDASSLATLAHREFCEAHKVDDYRLVQYAGVGAAQFAKHFESVFMEGRRLDGYVYADPSNPYVYAVLPILERYSRVNIRSMKL